NPRPSTPNPRPSTLDPQPSTLNPQPSTLNPKPSTLNPQRTCGVCPEVFARGSSAPSATPDPSPDATAPVPRRAWTSSTPGSRV
ncbi:hypothetical protein T484DRAFT_1616054, partial [Baffinella frigidus]